MDHIKDFIRYEFKLRMGLIKILKMRKKKDIIQTQDILMIDVICI